MDQAEKKRLKAEIERLERKFWEEYEARRRAEEERGRVREEIKLIPGLMEEAEKFQDEEIISESKEETKVPEPMEEVSTGTVLEAKEREKSTPVVRKQSKRKVWFGIGVLVVGALLIFSVLLSLSPFQERRIDGNLEDWEGKAYIEQSPVGMDVPIRRYSMDVDEKYVYFYLQVQSPRAVFESTGNERDTVVLFLATGENGYRFDGMNA
ncbi:MAG: hypothetical protein QXS83_02335, partial [Thermoplasmata archaeon]